jgi:hypothetical protein
MIHLFTVGRLSAHLLFEPRDLWVGAFWDIKAMRGFGASLFIYVCLIPLLPLCFEWRFDR